MGKCNRCGRKGLFFKVGKDGLCDNCRALGQIESQVEQLSEKLKDQQALYQEIKEQAERDATVVAQQTLDSIADKRDKTQIELDQLQESVAAAQAQQEKLNKSVQAAENKLRRSRELLKGIQYACDRFDQEEDFRPDPGLEQEIEQSFSPTVTLDLQCMNMRDLRKKFTENKKNIQQTFEKYEGRYTTKANMAIYKLMVIALDAELQNVLYNLGFGKLEDSLEAIRQITKKYFSIAAEGNQSIAPTLKKFIGEIEYFFLEAVRIEYEYYVKKERAKEEQRALREQMRQEAEERRLLEQQKKQVEKEESKYTAQMEQLQKTLAETRDQEKIQQLEERLAQLQQQLDGVAARKDEITRLQNGKAGNVYIISNLGSFGDSVFKIGMTRRLDPQERVNELGNASVPFPFDVHSFIFSEDAVGLESQLHKMLNDRRVNKVNLRKEFFNVSLDELETLVEQICPTAEFRRTLVAEQYRQSLSIDKVVEGEEEEEEEEDL